MSYVIKVTSQYAMHLFYCRMNLLLQCTLKRDKISSIGLTTCFICIFLSYFQPCPANTNKKPLHKLFSSTHWHSYSQSYRQRWLALLPNVSKSWHCFQFCLIVFTTWCKYFVSRCMNILNKACPIDLFYNWDTGYRAINGYYTGFYAHLPGKWNTT